MNISNPLVENSAMNFLNPSMVKKCDLDLKILGLEKNS